MSNIFCITSPKSVGVTFVDWSIHFLSGQKNFYSVTKKSWIPLTFNPITKLNAHGHLKNHPAGKQETKDYLEHLYLVSGTSPLSFYPYALHDVSIAKTLNIETENLTPEQFAQIQKYKYADYTNLVNYCLDQKLKVIYIDPSRDEVLYYKSIRALERLAFSTAPSLGVTQSIERIDQLFFSDSITQWNNIGLNSTWDTRERRALTRNQLDISYIDNFIFNTSLPHLWINSKSIWYNGRNTIKKIMKYLEIPIVEERWQVWQEIYTSWQDLQLNILEFNFNYEHIVNCIVNNWYYELNNLTLEDEIAIQHCLIYHHELNLKTWQLEKFPGNTQDLHKLLEPNTHIL
jgi:hypothetical protein